MTPIFDATAVSSRPYVTVTQHGSVSAAWEELFEGGHDAWEELFAALPDGWAAQEPIVDPRSGRWQMYAFDQREVPAGETRAWTAEAPTKELVVFEMARCLREIGEGRVPTR